MVSMCWGDGREWLVHIPNGGRSRHRRACRTADRQLQHESNDGYNKALGTQTDMGNVTASVAGGAAALKSGASTSVKQPAPLTEKPPGKVPAAPTDKQLLFIEDQVAQRADWNGENVLVCMKRLFGGLTESESECRKRRQKVDKFVPGVHNSFTFKLNVDGTTAFARNPRVIAAATTISTFLRRRMYRARWKQAVLVLVHRLRDEQRLQREEAALEHTICRFREILKEGFTASKVSVHGNLKTIQLRLVIDTTFDECYLTWTPSKKRDPRVMLHEIESVVPARKDMETAAVPVYLLRKVSYRRTFVLYIRTAHAKGKPQLPRRMILQVSNAKERDFFVKGFQRYLDNRTGEGYMDAAGVPRMDTRRAALSYFNPPAVSPPTNSCHPPAMSRLEELEFKEHKRIQPKRSSLIIVEPATSSSIDVLSGDEDYDGDTPVGRQPKRISSLSSTSRANGTVEEKSPAPLLSHLYSTRYDDMDMKAAEAALSSSQALTTQQVHMLDEEEHLSSVFDRMLARQQQR
ncbi:hypothetical protein H310_05042 [Aphanomyces invadans]|uniref:Uncharacterized protein n=1 Tax=Aphanomyces invadans TaxID=157072 RepID=A0A024UBR6_9STRA|nr:hypothetical protein H310_05042 [Aphanomyces invadans]ETW03645.1 hypothetical protein H310_05042 [Aphanomyces invadans]|eukprot:XP_008867874.1 hypothetical protein H310_05042 [Aphanomyces invadans]